MKICELCHEEKPLNNVQLCIGCQESVNKRALINAFTRTGREVRFSWADTKINGDDNYGMVER